MPNLDDIYKSYISEISDEKLKISFKEQLKRISESNDIELLREFDSKLQNISSGDTKALKELLDNYQVDKGDSKAKPFDIVKYGDKTPGIENHHGVLDVWAKNNIPGYVGRAKNSTSMALTAGKEGQHAATKAVYRDWLFERTGKKVGGKVDWKRVSPREIQDLTERMFDAAKVPSSARREYYREFNKYIYGLN